MKITLLDGGMGQELIRRAGKATALWSTQALLDSPGLVAEVHRDYAEAGASMATTNSYALHRDRLRAEGNHYAAKGTAAEDLEPRLFDLLDAALSEVDAVRDRSRVAGSVGPLRASYRADLNPPREEAVSLYGEIAGYLAPRVDVLLFETIASLEAAETCLEAGRKTGKPVWLSFTVDDQDGTKLRSGEAMTDAAKIGAGADAVLANCSAPEAMPKALDALAKAGVPTGAYGNAFQIITKAFLDGGTTADDLQARRDMGPETYADHAMRWLDHGATILGGCCETGPAHIAEIARRLKEAGHDIV